MSGRAMRRHPAPFLFAASWTNEVLFAAGWINEVVSVQGRKGKKVALGSCEGKDPSLTRERVGRMLSLCASACLTASPLGFINPWNILSLGPSSPFPGGCE